MEINWEEKDIYYLPKIYGIQEIKPNKNEIKIYKFMYKMLWRSSWFLKIL